MSSRSRLDGFKGQRKRWLSVLCCLAFHAASADVATDKSSTGLAVETVAESRIHGEHGDEFAPADRLRIGDEVFFTLRVRNTTSNPLQDAVIVRALPRNTRYVADSAVGPAARISYSIDGGVNFADPDRLVVSRSDGTSRAATSEDYTHIRWQLRHPLAAGATALLRFRGVFK